MTNTLSIRSYNRQRKGHSHTFHQLVLPLMGHINIELGDFSKSVLPNECVVIRQNCTHFFTADSHAKFIVADMEQLPDNLVAANTVIFSINAPLSAFLAFVLML